VQPAEHLVEIPEAACDPDCFAVALECGLRDRDRAAERLAEFLEAALGLPGRRQFEQFCLGPLDLLGAGVVEVVAEGVGDDVLADRD
jgi:hypothetical protein